MATLALSLAGQFVGGLVGGPIGATIGRALGGLAGSAVDGVLFGEKRESPAFDVRLQGSSEGGAVPRLYGWGRLAGNIIWARELELLAGEGAGAKGLGAQEGDEEVAASFAIALCEGEVHHMGRIWADGQLLDPEGLNLRFYRGTQTQLPDGLIEATQGVAPAYRGLCYLVVEQLPLSRFGNRIPQLSVELCRVVGTLEPQIRAVTVIPGATEFGYDPTPRVRMVGPGHTEGENTHVTPSVSNWTYSIDELTALCPNLKHVALVVAWFGDDLRCGHCAIGPRVEAADRSVEGVTWSVAGLGRDEVPVVSIHDGGPAYGGTPSDDAVQAAIADLVARGLSVTLYPLVMMDVPHGNGLPDPYGRGEQGAYPWRGRISCDPAPGVDGSPDQSAEAAAQIGLFAARYREMVLHYARLAKAAGGVETLVIGSEMRGLTTVRGPGNSFPFVTALVALAAEVRAIVGGSTRLTYAADWSEYSGYQPAGEKFFHLDPLWASPAIDAVGIDNYMPLADWRDGHGHRDAALAPDSYGLDYLCANVAGGEGFDWYYASEADRRSQNRTPISDGAHGEDWIWRYKDIRNWWANAHHDRPGGVRQQTPTAWVPGSKPIWFTELGCGAVDKGANQPNIFGDGKSAEGGLPYFSSGTPDPLIQRQVLRAHQQFWADSANNPAGMVDLERLYLWTWDARPYPAFPARDDIWADGVNHRNGHWLTGRLGGLAGSELAEVIAREHGVSLRAEAFAPFVTGYVLHQASTGRAALEPLLEISGTSLRNAAEGLELAVPRRRDALVLEPDALVAGDGPVLTRRRPDPAELPGRLAFTYQDRERDYLTATATAMARADGPLEGAGSNLVLDGAAARLAAERLLDLRASRRETLELALPPAQLALEPGDVVAIAGLAEGPFEITEIRDGLERRVMARTLPLGMAVATDIDRAVQYSAGISVASIPLVSVAALPPLPGDPDRARLVLGAFAMPWPGRVQIAEDHSGATIAELTKRSSLGVTVSALAAGPVAVWDRQGLEVELYAGHLSAMEPLAGSNRLAVETDRGDWEVIGFAEAVLVGPGRYGLRQLLRGLEGTGAAMGPIGAGRRVMVLDGRCQVLPMEQAWLGETRGLRVFAGSNDLSGRAQTAEVRPAVALPLAPVHVRAQRRDNGDVVLRWTRRSRADGDGWGLADSPLEHVPERYVVSILDAGTPLRQFDCGGPSATYSAAEQVADFGAAGRFEFTVQQVSAVLGAGHAAEGQFDG
jgi:hypothetical protein